MGEEAYLEFNFADPLVLEANDEEEPSGLIPEGLKVDVLSNELSGIVTIEEINYEDGVGFAFLRLKIDGFEAENLLGSKDETAETENETD